jgi:tetratricopeptide (TPR) repeat protein
LILFGAIQAAGSKGDLDGVIQATNVVAEDLGYEHTLTPTHMFMLTWMRTARLASLLRTEQYANTSALTTLTLINCDLYLARGPEGEPLLLQLCSAGIIFCEYAGDRHRSAIYRKLLLRKEALNDSSNSTLLSGVTAVARLLNRLSLYAGAISLIRDTLSQLEPSPSTANTRSELLYLLQWNLKDSFSHEEALQVHRKIVTEFDNDHFSDQVRSYVAWSGVEAVRSVLTLKQYDAANAISRQIANRFLGTSHPSTLRAAGWAEIERCKVAFAQGLFEVALKDCDEGIRALTTINMNGLLDEHLAWAYAQRALCLRRLGKFDQALTACDDMIEMFGTNPDIDVQIEVAWVMVEKSTCLRRAKRLAASVEAAKDMIHRFSTATETRIVKERIGALHAEGDTLLCQAKLLLQNGMTEDARGKLREAADVFGRASAADSTDPWHQACSAYAHFLLGNVTEAERCFRKALVVGKPDWQGDEHSEWSEESMFPIPEDLEFSRLRDLWASATST